MLFRQKCMVGGCHKILILYMNWFLLYWKVMIYKCANPSITFLLVMITKRDISTKMRSDGCKLRLTR